MPEGFKYARPGQQKPWGMLLVGLNCSRNSHIFSKAFCELGDLFM